MTQKPRLALYNDEAEKYIASLVTRKGTNASDSEKHKTRKALAEITAILQEQGHSWPDASDYDAYRRQHEDNKETKQNVSRIEKFFAWLEKEIETMADNEKTAQAELFSGNEPETWPEETPAPADKPKGKGGRKVISANGEKKSEKLMMYFTPELIADIRDWCCLKRISAVSYITGLIESDLHSTSKQQKLTVFRQLSDDA